MQRAMRFARTLVGRVPGRVAASPVRSTPASMFPACAFPSVVARFHELKRVSKPIGIRWMAAAPGKGSGGKKGGKKGAQGKGMKAPTISTTKSRLNQALR
jgi:hypothetical protein